jgi:hypothetical protein
VILFEVEDGTPQEVIDAVLGMARAAKFRRVGLRT